ncbi:hypothetical protein LRP52_19565 [Photobacterium sp. ZSDE20]|uniref:Uncharacterized protein n=1 Tax=Photobacterium pectinilyticum TaxID=2906793 RepID=A0ABT1N335_9GAMM|nr:hypothetical protein [Photobacterium sp. ZSDE20]MCQ1059158.1 hypothetical protein [Photobacterium sp. ZSDE20]MDD1824389.1 hypothetical protein [Photobacterium sp. ZSDE20]
MARSKRYKYVLLAFPVFWGSYSFFHYAYPAIKEAGVLLFTGAHDSSPSHYCPLSNEACEIEGKRISLDRATIKPMEAARIQVEWPSLPSEIDTVELTLEGMEMMMGVYRQTLQRQTDSDRFSGELLLPFCVSDEMTWQGKITATAISSQQPIYISIRMIK